MLTSAGSMPKITILAYCFWAVVFLRACKLRIGELLPVTRNHKRGGVNGVVAIFALGVDVKLTLNELCL